MDLESAEANKENEEAETDNRQWTRMEANHEKTSGLESREEYLFSARQSPGLLPAWESLLCAPCVFCG
jgi:hypothetical protein